MDASIKQQLYDHCKTMVNEKAQHILDAIKAAQDAANSETKSTAGDKHDTARAMMQLEVEQKSKQLAEAEKLKGTFTKFDHESGRNTIGLGSLVVGNKATYYISVGLGKVELNDQSFFCVSAGSPIAQALMGKKAGDAFEINGIKMQVNEVI